MGLFDNLNFDDPKTMGLLSAAANILSASGPSTTPRSFGQILGSGLGGGMQAYQGAIEQKMKRDEEKQMNDYRKAQIGELQAKTISSKNKQDVLSRIASNYEMDSTYKPSMADLLTIDPESAVKSILPGGSDFGVTPQVGINPSTGEYGFFVQDKNGNEKWSNAKVPPSYQYIPGSDYKAAQMFNKRGGEMSPIGGGSGMPQSSMMPNGGLNTSIQASEIAPVDDLAPWKDITSPKEQDSMKQRTYEQDRKRLDELNAKVAQGRSNMRDLERFGELNRQEGTGGLIDRIGVIPTFDEQKQEMESIQSRLAPQLRVEGSGASSDKDMGLYLKSLPGTDKGGNVNRSIREQYADQLKNAEEELAFKSKYLTQKGYLDGADEAYLASKQSNKNSGGMSNKDAFYRLPKPTQEFLLKAQSSNSGKPVIFNLDLGNGRTYKGTVPKADTEKNLRLMEVDSINRNYGVQSDAQNNQVKQPTQQKQAQSYLPALPTANKSNQGKTAIDHDTGKRYKSNGMQWMEVK